MDVLSPTVALEAPQAAPARAPAYSGPAPPSAAGAPPGGLPFGAFLDPADGGKALPPDGSALPLVVPWLPPVAAPPPVVPAAGDGRLKGVRSFGEAGRGLRLAPEWSELPVLPRGALPAAAGAVAAGPAMPAVVPSGAEAPAITVPAASAFGAELPAQRPASAPALPLPLPAAGSRLPPAPAARDPWLAATGQPPTGDGRTPAPPLPQIQGAASPLPATPVPAAAPVPTAAASPDVPAAPPLDLLATRAEAVEGPPAGGSTLPGAAVPVPAREALPPAATMQLSEPPGSEAWSRALGERVVVMADRDLTQARIALNPPQLGPIEVRVHVNGDQASVAFTAHSHVTREALEQALPRLREMLGGHGFTQVDVNVSQHSFSERPRHAPPWAPAPDDRIAAPDATAGAAPQPPRVLTGLDLYA